MTLMISWVKVLAWITNYVGLPYREVKILHRVWFRLYGKVPPFLVDTGQPPR